MIWFSFFDPASLCLNVNTSLIASGSSGSEIAKAIDCCIQGEIKSFYYFYGLIDNESDKARCAYLASCIWHEQRHFLDIVLTNYGNWQFRRYNRCYANINSIIRGLTQDDNEIVLPIEIYTDPVRRIIFNKKAPSSSLSKLIDNIKKAEQINYIDGKKSDGLQIGGYSHLEQLAYIFQIGALENRIHEHGFLINDYFKKNDPEGKKYSWIMYFNDIFNFSPISMGRDAVVYRIGRMPIIFYAALNNRNYYNKPDYNDTMCSPAMRMELIVDYVSNHKHLFNTLNFDEFLINTNQMSTKLFGMTMVDEIENDIIEQEKYLNIINENAESELREYNIQYLDLRKRIFSLLNETPKLILDPDVYSSEMLDKVYLLPVYNFPAGISASKLENTTYEGLTSASNKNNQIFWTATPKVTDHAHKIALNNINWCRTLHGTFSPLAKMFLHGRKHHLTVGYEYSCIEQMLNTLGINVKYEDEFLFPENLIIPASAFYEFKNSESGICDFCNEQINKPSGFLISPWLVDEITLSNIVELPKAFSFDWSPWLACNSCKNRIFE